ncbi:MAG: hypothetical protein M3R38_12360, partial [Actinomycetota bacterium]|nr:hypothetical protein [Actinomycetota bacterium]
MSLRDLRARLARIEARVESGDAPTWDEYWAAARRERARRLGAAYGRLARIGNGPPAPHPGRGGRESLLAGDTTEQAEADRRILARWEEANEAPVS